MTDHAEDGIIGATAAKSSGHSPEAQAHYGAASKRIGKQPDKHAELRRLAEAATPKKWVAEDYCDPSDKYVWKVHEGEYPVARAWFKYDAEFIAAADPQTILELLDEIDELKREVKERTETGSFTLYEDSPQIRAERRRITRQLREQSAEIDRLQDLMFSSDDESLAECENLCLHRCYGPCGVETVYPSAVEPGSKEEEWNA